MLVAGAHAQITITPDACDLVLNPGDVAVVDVQVCIPGESSVALADVLILADVTGSMGSVVAQLQADAVSIVNTLFARTGVDIDIGIAQYRDFPFNASAFDLLQPVTNNAANVVAAINTWSAGGGSDGSEGQLFALHELATEPAVAWRLGAKRIIVWFGDAPGHDPICNAISGEGIDITEASATADLLAAGPGGTTVIAISTFTGGYTFGLDDDPQISAFDYSGTCAIGGASGQATRIAAATNGLALAAATPADITDAILDSIDVVLSMVEVSLEPKGDIIPFVTSIVPGSVDVIIPSDPEEEVCVTFQVTFTGQDCDPLQTEFLGAISVLFDGAGVGVEKTVTINQPDCPPPECHLVLAVGGGNEAFTSHGHTWTTQLAGVTDSFGVLLNDIPEFRVPFPTVTPQAGHFMMLRPVSLITAQVVMWNPEVFPANPEQFSNPVALVVWSNGWVTARSFGVGDNMLLTTQSYVGRDGHSYYRFPFQILGF